MVAKIKTHHVMFDVDGTLVASRELDGICFLDAVYQVLGHSLDDNWRRYVHVTDRGILDQHIDDHGLQERRDEIQAEVKRVFIEKTTEHLQVQPTRQIPGAADFIDALRSLDYVTISVATGGWKETALMKLESAGVNISGIPIASSDDHYSRTEIMKIAGRMALAGNTGMIPCTYFGDGEWDKKACAALGFNFVLVGDQTSHHQNIPDFSDTRRLIELIRLYQTCSENE